MTLKEKITHNANSEAEHVIENTDNIDIIVEDIDSTNYVTEGDLNQHTEDQKVTDDQQDSDIQTNRDLISGLASAGITFLVRKTIQQIIGDGDLITFEEENPEYPDFNDSKLTFKGPLSFIGTQFLNGQVNNNFHLGIWNETKNGWVADIGVHVFTESGDESFIIGGALFADQKVHSSLPLTVGNEIGTVLEIDDILYLKVYFADSNITYKFDSNILFQIGAGSINLEEYPQWQEAYDLAHPVNSLMESSDSTITVPEKVNAVWELIASISQDETFLGGGTKGLKTIGRIARHFHSAVSTFIGNLLAPHTHTLSTSTVASNVDSGNNQRYAGDGTTKTTSETSGGTPSGVVNTTINETGLDENNVAKGAFLGETIYKHKRIS